MRWVFNRLSKYSDIYENGQMRIFMLLIFFFFVSFLFLFFVLYFTYYDVFGLVIFDIFGVVLCLYACYLILFKYQYLFAQYVILFIITGYIACVSYVLGSNKNAILLFCPLIFAIYSISPVSKRHLNISSIIVLLSFTVLIYMRTHHVSPYNDSFMEVEYFNVILSFFATYYVILSKAFAEKLSSSLNKEKIDNLAKEAHKDHLTNLYNKRYIDEYLQTNIDLKGYYAVLSDIDFFKKVNDTYGHNTGDYTLKTVSKIMVDTLQEDSIVVRWGGEEFLILLKSDNSTSMQAIDKLRNTIERYEFTYEQISFNITMSFGVDTIKDSKNYLEYIKNADVALYYAKNNGRNRVIYYNDIKNVSKNR